MFTHAMDFFQECASLKKPIPEHFFTSLLSRDDESVNMKAK
jgi:hypothetical protein